MIWPIHWEIIYLASLNCFLMKLFDVPHPEKLINKLSTMLYRSLLHIPNVVDLMANNKRLSFSFSPENQRHNVCRESLRYIPPIPMTVREALNDDVLGGYFVPKGTTVYVLANAINRLPSYWGETADEFLPDRWDDLPPTFSPNAYMTFLQGIRGCTASTRGTLCKPLKKYT